MTRRAPDSAEHEDRQGKDRDVLERTATSASRSTMRLNVDCKIRAGIDLSSLVSLSGFNFIEARAHEGREQPRGIK
jgi:hypothetical protein